MRITQSLIAAWAASGVVAAADDAAFGAFRGWLKERGASFGATLSFGVDVATGLRGLLADDTISAGTELFSIPGSTMLTVDVAREKGTVWQRYASGTGSGAEDDELLSPTHSAFALFLLEQRKEGSAWQPWMKVLPDSFEGFPLFYGEDDLKELQASPVARVVRLDQDAVARDHGLFTAKAWPELGIEDFRWARTAVKSRVFGLRSLSGGKLKEEIVAMVPLADFVNHPPEGPVEQNVLPSYDVESGAFSFKALKDIHVGEGIYWDYGFKSNRNSLQRYGFVSKDRVALTDMPLFFKFTEHLGPEAPGRSAKLVLIKAAQDAGQLAMEADGTVMHELSLSLLGPNAERLLGHARFMSTHINPKDAVNLYQLCPGTYCIAIGLQSERRALHKIVEILDALLSEYSTSASDDKEILDGDISHKDGSRWQGLVVRYGEKRILRGFQNMVAAIDPLFDLSPDELKAAVAEKWSDPRSDIHKYVQQNLTMLVERAAAATAAKAKSDAEAAAKPDASKATPPAGRASALNGYENYMLLPALAFLAGAGYIIYSKVFADLGDRKSVV